MNTSTATRLSSSRVFTEFLRVLPFFTVPLFMIVAVLVDFFFFPHLSRSSWSTFFFGDEPFCGLFC